MSGYIPVEQTATYKHAYYLTTQGFTVFPLHFPTGPGKCSCGDPACSAQVGKHPVVKWSKIESPELGLQHVHMAIGRMGNCNLGLVTGRKRGPGPGLVAIDLDIKDGKNGQLAFQRWCHEHGIADAETQTAWAQTGSGGYHFFFLHPEGDIKISSRANILVDGGGIDVRGDGGYVAVAPSIHRSGGAYTWGVWPTVETLKPLPQILLDALRGGSHYSAEPGAPNQAAPYTPTLDDLMDLATSLERSKQSRTKNLGRQLKQALKGEPIAIDGGGHDTFRDILFHVGREWPQAEPTETLEHFRQSVTARQIIRPDASCGMENLLDSLVSAQSKATEDNKSWTNQLSYTTKGEIKACEGNILTMLEHHSEWRGIFAYNDRSQKTMFMRQPPIAECAGPFPRPITDADGAQMAKWFTQKTKMAVTSAQCLPCASSVSKAVSYDPLKEWFDNLPPWDGIERASTWLISCGGAADNKYTREVSKKWLLQVVRRTYEPGCQADYTLILQGAQGIKKSTLLKMLLADTEYFMQGLPHIGSKDAVLSLQGPAIVELAELSTFRRSENEAMKAFLTTTQDSIRLPYDKLNTNLKRRCVLAGTTNDDDYLKDATGNRRYWPISVVKCDPELLATHREQLWAEVVYAYKTGEASYLDDNTEAMAVEEQAARLESDSWENLIEAWLAKAAPAGSPPINHPQHEGVTLPQIFEHALQLDDRAKWNRAAEMRVSSILKARKYRRIKRRTAFSGGKYIWVYAIN